MGEGNNRPDVSEASQQADIQELTAIPRDITRQVVRLGRVIDRLEPGRYTIDLEKGDRLSEWEAIITNRSGVEVRRINLTR